MQLILIIIVVALVVYILFKAAKVMIKVVAVLVILLAAYFTNPDIDAHRDAAIVKASHEEIELARHDIATKDLKIISFTESPKGIIGVGAFTKVWIFRL
ncbi:hypothetical protein [Pseudochryseolinea flava]|uniref:Uncharacterized protein n=1 Tax=Pseudochryseolinea flava TaxID=2059302 RepID=A0A364Y4G9_9BACT|nr:hypothetical protein [Pseudochryseolinea flava]RAW00705.1 hypothetical protein DQQ10_14060 [Pseudochryseolinea flava]